MVIPKKKNHFIVLTFSPTQMFHKQEKNKNNRKNENSLFFGGLQRKFQLQVSNWFKIRNNNTLGRHRRDRFATMWLDAGALCSVHAARSLLTNGDVALTA